MKRIDSPAPRDSKRFVCGVCLLCVAFVLAADLVRSAWAAGPVPELLEAEKAFSVSARLADDKTLELRYFIADGYYMYRDRFRFSINGQPVSMSRKAWPTGRWKQDATFGKVVTYRNSVRLLFPAFMTVLDGTQTGHEPLRLIASSQGCADVGICYPPLRQTLLLVPGSSAWVGPQDEFSAGFSHERRSDSGLTDYLKSGK